MFVQVEDDGKLGVYVHGEDQCMTCENQSLCPLLATLQDEAVILKYEAIAMINCGLYKEMEATDDNELA